MYWPGYMQGLQATRKNEVYVFQVFAKHNLNSYYCDNWKSWEKVKLGKKFKD
jgi:hypothetical protein